MKIIVILCCLLICCNTNAQNWSEILNTGIYKITITNDWGLTTYFKKDSTVIRVPGELQTDFTQLFSDNKDAFRLIDKECVGIMPVMLGDSLEAYFDSSHVKYLTYFTKREIQNKRDSILWMMTSRTGQGQPCWPLIYIKKERIKNHVRLIFLSVDRGMCEI